MNFPTAFDRDLSRAIAKTWTDLNFRERLLTNPKRTLAKLGIIPPGVNIITASSSTVSNVKMIEVQGNQLHIYIPSQPTGLDDVILDPDVGSNAMFCFKLSCCCLEMDPKQ